ncbi:unnamed protein product [Ectocarpus sp. CCAP 1310/34]|nr:unnamed protein product [Ectocarpus sp. CCAP 1310/34]
MVAELLKGSNNGALSHGDVKRVVAIYKQTPKTVSKYWKLYNQKKEAGEEDPDLHNKRKGNSGQKGLDIATLKEALQDIHLKNRTTIRSIAAALGIPKSTLFDNLNNLGLRSCSRFLKPLLSDDWKAQRLAWALRWVRSSAGDAHLVGGNPARNPPALYAGVGSVPRPAFILFWSVSSTLFLVWCGSW